MSLSGAENFNARESSLFETDQRFSEVTVRERGALVNMLDLVLPRQANLFSDTTALADRIGAPRFGLTVNTKLVSVALHFGTSRGDGRSRKAGAGAGGGCFFATGGTYRCISPPASFLRQSLPMAEGDLQREILQRTLKEVADEETESDPCVICLETITEPSVAVPCHHSNFDYLCLLSWLEQQPNCPLCMDSKKC